MTGTLYQLRDEENDESGLLWVHESSSLSNEQIQQLWSEYYKSDDFDGVDGFVDSLQSDGYEVDRVYTEDINP
jgi:hypothetical protein